MKRSFITLTISGIALSMTVMVSRPADAAVLSGVSGLTTNLTDQVNGAITAPIASLINQITTPTSVTQVAPTSPIAATTTATGSTISASSATSAQSVAVDSDEAAIIAANQSAPTSTYLSTTPAERISSFTYPSTKLNPVLTSRLNILATTLAVSGLFFIAGGYELAVRVRNGLAMVIGRNSVEEVS